MATTDRRFDDDRVLEKLSEIKGLTLGEYDDPDIEVQFDGAGMNFTARARVVATLTWRVSPEEADAILDHARSSD